ncbi:low molecular weight phosphatase family protein [Okibacterium endophyticum]
MSASERPRLGAGAESGLRSLFTRESPGSDAHALASDNGPFTILVVCTGNVCRSPLAQQLLAARLAQLGVNAVVHSAGTAALVGEAMTSQAAGLSTGFGVDPSAHRARQLTAAQIEGSDLVLTATRAHRAVVVAEVPRASRNTFTLNQFARIARELGPADRSGARSAQDVVTLIAERRGFALPPENADDDDVIDPYGRPQGVYDASGAAIAEAVEAIASAFAGARGR